MQQKSSERFAWKFFRDTAVAIVGGIVIEPTLKRLQFDVGPYLQQIWFCIFVFITLDGLWRSSIIRHWVPGFYGTSSARKKKMSYVVVALLGAGTFSIYWFVVTIALGGKENPVASKDADPPKAHPPIPPTIAEDKTPKTIPLIKKGEIRTIVSPLSGGIEITTEENERRNELLQTLKSEYIVSHYKDLYPQFAASNQLPPVDWMNRRLYEMGEKWAIGIPFSISSLSNHDLAAKTSEITDLLRELGKKYARIESENNTKWWHASIEAHSRNDWTHDLERRDKEVQEMTELGTALASDYGRCCRPDVRSVYQAVLVRLPQQQSASDVNDIRATAALERAGVHISADVFAVANYLDGLAQQLH